jgi:hypothetical protein
MPDRRTHDHRKRPRLGGSDRDAQAGGPSRHAAADGDPEGADTRTRGTGEDRGHPPPGPKRTIAIWRRFTAASRPSRKSASFGAASSRTGRACSSSSWGATTTTTSSAPPARRWKTSMSVWWRASNGSCTTAATGMFHTCWNFSVRVRGVFRRSLRQPLTRPHRKVGPGIRPEQRTLQPPVRPIFSFFSGNHSSGAALIRSTVESRNVVAAGLPPRVSRMALGYEPMS